MRLEFHDPAGVVESSRLHAPRLASLDGKTIGFLSNDQWQAHRMLPLAKELIEADHPGARVLALDAFPRGNAEIPKDATTALVQQAGVDAVIVGNAS